MKGERGRRRSRRVECPLGGLLGWDPFSSVKGRLAMRSILRLVAQRLVEKLLGTDLGSQLGLDDIPGLDASRCDVFLEACMSTEQRSRV